MLGAEGHADATAQCWRRSHRPSTALMTAQLSLLGLLSLLAELAEVLPHISQESFGGRNGPPSGRRRLTGEH